MPTLSSTTQYISTCYRHTSWECRTPLGLADGLAHLSQSSGRSSAAGHACMPPLPPSPLWSYKIYSTPPRNPALLAGDPGALPFPGAADLPNEWCGAVRTHPCLSVLPLQSATMSSRALVRVWCSVSLPKRRGNDCTNCFCLTPETLQLR